MLRKVTFGLQMPARSPFGGNTINRAWTDGDPHYRVIPKRMDNGTGIPPIGDLRSAAPKYGSPFGGSTINRTLTDGDDDVGKSYLCTAATQARSPFGISTTTRTLTDGDDEKVEENPWE